MLNEKIQKVNFLNALIIELDLNTVSILSLDKQHNRNHRH